VVVVQVVDVQMRQLWALRWSVLDHDAGNGLAASVDLASFSHERNFLPLSNSRMKIDETSCTAPFKPLCSLHCSCLHTTT